MTNSFSNPPKISALLQVYYQNTTLNFTLKQVSNKVCFNYTELYSIFMLNQNATTIPAQLIVEIDFQDQTMILQNNISFANEGVTQTTKNIDYANSYYQINVDDLAFPAGKYYSDTSRDTNMFQIIIIDMANQTIDSFIEFNVSLIIDPFCMTNQSESQYEILTGDKAGVKTVMLKCTKAIQQGKIQVLVNGNLIGKEMEFQVYHEKIDVQKSSLISDFFINRQNFTFITFSMKFVDFYGNVIDDPAENVSDQVNVFLMNSKKDAKMSLEYLLNEQNYTVKNFIGFLDL